MEKRENQRVLLTKRLLLEALFSLLETKKIAHISVTQLCKAAGINRATFYKYYGTPQDILNEQGRQYVVQLMRIQDEGRGRKGIEQIIEDSCEYMYKNRKLIRLLIENGVDSAVATDAFAQLFHPAAMAAMARVKAQDDAEYALLLTYIASGCYHLLVKWLLEELEKTPQEIASLLYRLSTHGWMTEME